MLNTRNFVFTTIFVIVIILQNFVLTIISNTAYVKLTTVTVMREGEITPEYDQALKEFDAAKLSEKVFQIVLIIIFFIFLICWLYPIKDAIPNRTFLFITMVYLHFSLFLNGLTLDDGWSAMFMLFLYTGVFGLLWLTTFVLLIHALIKKKKFNFKLKNSWVYPALIALQIFVGAINPGDCGDAPGSYNFIQVLNGSATCNYSTHSKEVFPWSFPVILVYLGFTIFVWYKTIFRDRKPVISSEQVK